VNEEVRASFESGKEIEYHLWGMEQGANILPGPGWYTCVVTEIYKNGDVEICFTYPEIEDVCCTVRRQNIPIAFRKRSK